MKKIILILVANIFLFFAFAFAQWQTDPSQWTEVVRASFATLVLFSTVMIYTYPGKI